MISSTPSGFDFSRVKLDAQKRLFALLNKFEGTKTIIWDDKLIGPFEFVANAAILKKHDVVRLCRLTDVRTSVSTSTDFTLVFIRKDYLVATQVADLLSKIKNDIAKISLVFVPQRCAGFEKLLKHNKVHIERLNSIEELEIELFVMDTNIISMENENVYRDIYLNGDFSSIYQISKGLIKIQESYGQIKKISSQGKAAELVHDLLMKQRKIQTPSKITPQIHQLILIDRRIDLVTPLLTQLTYEGLLDEIFTIKHGTLTLPAEKFRHHQQPQTDTTEMKRFEMRSAEELYSRLRDCHINGVADVLKQSAKNLQAEYEECNSAGKTIHEMSKIVKRLNHLKGAKNSQSNHVAIAELVNEQTLKAEFIYGLRIEHELLQEDRINRVIPGIDEKLLRQEDPLHVIRLICLQSMINNGLKSKVCDSYKREIVQNYGTDYVLFLLRLEQARLLLGTERDNETGNFSQIKSRFALINDNVDECNPNHPSYVYGGYLPLTVALAQSLSQNANNSSRDEPKTVLVFFIGGCTFAEISALRFLSQQDDNNCEFIIGTSKIISGRSFLKSMAADIDSIKDP